MAVVRPVRAPEHYWPKYVWVRCACSHCESVARALSSSPVPYLTPTFISTSHINLLLCICIYIFMYVRSAISPVQGKRRGFALSSDSKHVCMEKSNCKHWKGQANQKPRKGTPERNQEGKHISEQWKEKQGNICTRQLIHRSWLRPLGNNMNKYGASENKYENPLEIMWNKYVWKSVEVPDHTMFTCISYSLHILFTSLDPGLGPWPQSSGGPGPWRTLAAALGPGPGSWAKKCRNTCK